MYTKNMKLRNIGIAEIHQIYRYQIKERIRNEMNKINRKFITIRLISKGKYQCPVVGSHTVITCTNYHI